MGRRPIGAQVAARAAATQRTIDPEVEKTINESPYKSEYEDINDLIKDQQQRQKDYDEETARINESNRKTQMWGGITEGVAALANIIGTAHGASPMKWESPQPGWRKEVNDISNTRQKNSMTMLERLKELQKQRSKIGSNAGKWKIEQENKEKDFGIKQQNADTAAVNAETKKKASEDKATNDKAVTDSVVRKNDAAAEKYEAEAEAYRNGTHGKKPSSTKKPSAGDGETSRTIVTNEYGNKETVIMKDSDWGEFYGKYLPQVREYVAKKHGYDSFEEMTTTPGTSEGRVRQNKLKENKQAWSDITALAAGGAEAYTAVDKYLRYIDGAIEELKSKRKK